MNVKGFNGYMSICLARDLVVCSNLGSAVLQKNGS